jgi:hypothetical protein
MLFSADNSMAFLHSRLRLIQPAWFTAPGASRPTEQGGEKQPSGSSLL